MMAKLHQVGLLIFPLVLIALLIIAGVASYNIWNLSLPISNAIGVAGILLPIVTTGGLEGVRSLLTSHDRSARGNKILARSIIPYFVLLIIYETAVATLSLTHLVPNDNLNCGLDQKWDGLFRSKDGNGIRRIQDAHQCCGLNSILDRPWPFQNRDHGVNECAKAFNRAKACLGSWRRDEQTAAGLLLLVAISTFLLKLIILFLVRTRSSWLHSSIWGKYSAFPAVDAGNRESGHGSEYPGHDHRRIEGPYRDNPVLNNVDQESSSEPETVANANHNPDNRQINEGPVLQPSRLIEPDNAWREEAR